MSFSLFYLKSFYNDKLIWVGCILLHFFSILLQLVHYYNILIQTIEFQISLPRVLIQFNISIAKKLLVASYYRLNLCTITYMGKKRLTPQTDETSLEEFVKNRMYLFLFFSYILFWNENNNLPEKKVIT